MKQRRCAASRVEQKYHLPKHLRITSIISLLRCRDIVTEFVKIASKAISNQPDLIYNEVMTIGRDKTK